MRAIAILVEEHDHILRGLDALEATAQALAEGRAQALKHLEGLVRFFQRFADACHHAKEENVLFPAFAEAGMPTGGGPIAVMLHEHDEGRAMVDRMVTFGPKVADGIDAAEAWQRAALSFAAMLRAHIGKENDILYPMGEGLLDPGADARLLSAYEHHEAEAMADGEKAELLRLLESLRATAGL